MNKTEITVESHKGSYTAEMGASPFAGLEDGLKPNQHLIIDAKVAELYKGVLSKALASSSVLKIEAVEPNKSLEKMPEYVTALTENGIKQLHVWLLQYSDKDVRHRGEYKKIPIRIEAFDSRGKSVGIIFETTPPLETPYKMEQLIAWTNRAFKKKELHPLIIIGIFVVLFLAIHPFQDGNGRLGRALYILSLLQSDDKYLSGITPYIAIDRHIEQRKTEYYSILHKVSGGKFHQDPTKYKYESLSWFFINVINESLEDIKIYKNKKS